MLIIGSLTFLPGIFHLIIILRAYLGHRGYTYAAVRRYR